MNLEQKEYSTGIPVGFTTGIYAASIVGLNPLVTFCLAHNNLTACQGLS